ncbi:MAG: polysaccharide deacetylase [Rhizobiaceae bacterium]
MPYPVRVPACLTALLATSTLALAGAAPMPRTPPQVVIISFDSAQDIAQWKRSRALAARTGARFTYFLSCVYLLTPETKRLYDAPGKGPGRSNIGFARSKAEVADRLEQINRALAEGHEIGSHACGHFDGKGWSKADWLAEFAAFRDVFRDAYRINGIAGEPAGWREAAAGRIKGFRAPYLSTAKAMYAALAQSGFAYDASGVSRGPVEPAAAGGVERFALPQIPEGPQARRVIAMDYNLFVRHSGGFDRPDEAAAFQARSYEAFKAAFDEQYRGQRMPLQLGFHFTLMNDGAYWNALEQFAGEVCVKPDVVCTSYAGYLSRADQRDSPAGG